VIVTSKYTQEEIRLGILLKGIRTDRKRWRRLSIRKSLDSSRPIITPSHRTFPSLMETRRKRVRRGMKRILDRPSVNVIERGKSYTCLTSCCIGVRMRVIPACPVRLGVWEERSERIRRRGRVRRWDGRGRVRDQVRRLDRGRGWRV